MPSRSRSHSSPSQVNAPSQTAAPPSASRSNQAQQQQLGGSASAGATTPTLSTAAQQQTSSTSSASSSVTDPAQDRPTPVEDALQGIYSKNPAYSSARDMMETEQAGHNQVNALPLEGGTWQTGEATHYAKDGNRNAHDVSFQTPNNLEFYFLYGGFDGSNDVINGRSRKDIQYEDMGSPQRNYDGPEWLDVGQAPGQDRLTPDVRAYRQAEAEDLMKNKGLRRCPDDLVDELLSYRERLHPPAAQAQFKKDLAEIKEFLQEVNTERLDDFWKEYGGSKGGEKYNISGNGSGSAEDRLAENKTRGVEYSGEFKYSSERSITRKERDRIEQDMVDKQIDLAKRRPELSVEQRTATLGPKEMDEGDAGYIFEYVDQLLKQNGNQISVYSAQFNKYLDDTKELITGYEVVEDSNGTRLFIPMLGVQDEDVLKMWPKWYIKGDPPNEQFFMEKHQGNLEALTSDVQEGYQSLADSPREFTPDRGYKQHTKMKIERAKEFEQKKAAIDGWVGARTNFVNALMPLVRAVKGVKASKP